MARTLEAEAPSNLSSFTIGVIVAGVVTETITMANVAAEGPTWRGTIAQAGSVGEAKLNYFFNGAAVAAGRFHSDISGTDGTTSYARELVKVELPFRNATATQNLTGTTVGLTAAAIASIWSTALTEAYRSTGATGTAAQLLYEILQNITQFSIAGTRKTVKKLDATTNAKTYTLNSSTSPTSITEEL